MRILHTSDWHLGKTLEGCSRLQEQEQFLEELLEISERRSVDIILIAGDVFDSPNPSAAAESLFYQTLKSLAKQGRAIVVIAGNHDNPERLMAAAPLAREHGVILLGMPKTVAQCGKYNGFEVYEAGSGYLKLAIRNEKVVILSLPYPSEKRLNEILSGQDDENLSQKAYSDRIGEIFAHLSQQYEADSINLAVSHLYVNGGLESDSERRIQLGGGLAVDAAMLPRAQYVALGHLHRPQKVSGAGVPAYYSGSPLQYSRSEVGYSKAVFLVEAVPEQPAQVEEIWLHNYKPIEVWECNSIEMAIEKCRQEQAASSWVYIDIYTERVLTQAEIKEMKSLRQDIVQIRPILNSRDECLAHNPSDFRELNLEELFKSFYRFQKQGAAPPAELTKLFLYVMEGGDEQDEAAATEDQGLE
ncbi:Exonuclease SbcD [Syntrophomonas zehnderi OL-4]|uniref:Nuclease SbcCD subunit D n=1 Tax=Syntrophomonas zehnderi OL-4 TaxID=690567 RepID=A0A0E4C7D0_9FIRM|nr:exonuclease SbcCD subunit D C-terminal domain-containing protein [Syntrophomonas zehnderi]CFW97350.1 Exonuclease SbcD [Syntrophomonas zehnderi OL-4]